mmetsp:Transcript_690/g.1920  ORF Transcript_690/g.1920 Transcript_690/m.1920 type:complete len:380 (+) Transcript_690:285-1424(+)
MAEHSVRALHSLDAEACPSLDDGDCVLPEDICAGLRSLEDKSPELFFHDEKRGQLEVFACLAALERRGRAKTPFTRLLRARPPLKGKRRVSPADSGFRRVLHSIPKLAVWLRVATARRQGRAVELDYENAGGAASVALSTEIHDMMTDIMEEDGLKLPDGTVIPFANGQRPASEWIGIERKVTRWLKEGKKLYAVTRFNWTNDETVWGDWTRSSNLLPRADPDDASDAAAAEALDVVRRVFPRRFATEVRRLDVAVRAVRADETLGALYDAVEATMRLGGDDPAMLATLLKAVVGSKIHEEGEEWLTRANLAHLAERITAKIRDQSYFQNICRMIAPSSLRATSMIWYVRRADSSDWSRRRRGRDVYFPYAPIHVSGRQ